VLSLLLGLLLAVTDHAQAGKQLFQQGKLPEAIAELRLAVEAQPRNASAWYNLAYTCRKAARYDDAVAAYKRYAELAPGDADADYGLAESQRLAGHAMEAITAYQHYLSKEKRSGQEKWLALAKQHISELSAAVPSAAVPSAAAPPAASVLAPLVPAPAANVAAATEFVAAGDAAFAAKDFRKALFAYQDAIRAQPKNVAALVKAGEAYARLGHETEAVEQWSRALQLEPDNETAKADLARKGAISAPPLLPVDESAARGHYAKGVQLVNEQKFDAAVAELDRALTLSPRFVEALIARGSARIGQGRFQDALADYEAAHDRDPSLAAPLFGLAEAHRGLGDGQKAAELYRRYAASEAWDVQPRLKQYALDTAQSAAPKP
jgi:tetratricopeptide (TPR) repeat protein